MVISRKLSRSISGLHNSADLLCHSGAFRLIREFESVTFFTVVAVIIAACSLWSDISAQMGERISRTWQTVSRAGGINTGKVDPLNYLATEGEDLRWIHLSPTAQMIMGR